MNQNSLCLYDKVVATRDAIRARIGDRAPIIGLVLGSGLGGIATAAEDAVTIPYTEFEHIPRSTVPGHAGTFVFGRIAGVDVAIMNGRTHYYEGHDLADLTIGVRAMVMLGCKAILLTNAAGGIHTDHRPGDLMCITDHINMQWVNPLRGPADDRLGPRFLDMSLAYDRELRRLLAKEAVARKIKLHMGVYAAISGPSYETPAEIKAMRVMGADAVGMSTVHEAIASRHAGARVIGISLISNLAAGIEDAALSHEEVTATANRVADRTIDLLVGFLPKAAKELAKARKKS